MQSEWQFHSRINDSLTAAQGTMLELRIYWGPGGGPAFTGFCGQVCRGHLAKLSHREGGNWSTSVFPRSPTPGAPSPWASMAVHVWEGWGLGSDLHAWTPGGLCYLLVLTVSGPFRCPTEFQGTAKVCRLEEGSVFILLSVLWHFLDL